MSATISPQTPHSPATDPDHPLLVSVVIPCLNEEENIVAVVTQAREAIADAGITGEVVVADNNSTDRSAELGAQAGARVVHVPTRGYGAAYMGGFSAAKGKYIVMGDADLTYDFHEIPNFVRELDDGADLVMGNRMKNIQPGAMPWLHQYVGNPLLSGFLNLLFKTGVRDAHCGMRAVRRSALPAMDLRTPGMEFASEMVIRASKAKLDIREFDIQYHPRGGESKLSTWRDGWRHLRFLLAHSPTHLFLIPGLFLTVVGALIMATVLSGVNILGRDWSVHSLMAGALLTIIGTQVVSLGLCAHAYGMYFMGDVDPWFDRMRARFRLEHGLAIGGAVILVGVIAAAIIIIRWAADDFGALSQINLAIASVTTIVIGVQVFFSSFLLSIIGLRRTTPGG
ncbi:glycosyltransferase family 2 protein [Patulibacter sp.]|uniref:glycosyltransferase family 2 protein n=1 Tax=Patulibacter sp. TaxID=1912859 RepID=UPI002723BD4B|nr:glycosyltransferase family 2 protein [Patulibacter sp.]MDO9408778.1 glycosyltransferase family 2 protein [Patulibacter sp.]